MKNTLKHPGYRADVDGLRAVAVLSVIGFHAFPDWVRGGFVGVDLFFVISGFLIGTIILTGLRDQNFSFATFYARRVKRIFPALILVLLVSAGLGWFLLFPKEYQSLGKHMAAAAVYISNLVLWRESGYFDSVAETKPLLHLWSLAIEEQFYLFWPLLLFWAWRKRLFPLILTCAVLALSFGANAYFIHDKPEATFYLPVTRIWELLIGSLLAYLQLGGVTLAECFNKISSSPIRTVSFNNLLSSTGGCLLLLALLLLDRQKEFPGWWALLPTVSAFCIIAAGPQAWLNRIVLAHPVIVWFGLISYPLYLWHWPLLSYARIVAATTPPIEVRLIAVLLSIVLAWLTYRWLETPIRTGRSSIAKVAVPSLLMAAIGVGALFLYHSAGLTMRFSPATNALFGTLERGEISDQACRDTYQKKLGNNYCSIIGSGSQKIFVIGDSHSQAVFSGYGPTLAQQGFTVIHLSQSGCPFIVPEPDQTYFMRNPGMPKIADCNEKFARILDAVIAENPQAILYANDGWFYAQKYVASGLASTLQRIPSHIPVYYFWQNPSVPFDPMRCINRLTHGVEACQFSSTEYVQSLSGYEAIIDQVRSEHPNLHLIRPADVICDAEHCSVLKDGGFIFAEDGLHFSSFGAHWIAARLPLDLKPSQTKTD